MRRLSKDARVQLALDIVEGQTKAVLTDGLVAKCCGITPSCLSRRLAARRAQQQADIAILSLQQAAE
jgi:hypothetical protein